MSWPSVVWIFLAALLPGVHCDTHHFLRQPFDTTVREGGTALLRCAIGNKQTAVQWTVGGFGLGTSMTDPRLSFQGQEEKGEYNLRITDVQLSDDGEYSCQAAPDFNKGLLALKSRNAYLNVVVPPKEFTIDPEASGAIAVKFLHQVTITCTVPDTKPASEISWRVGDADYHGLISKKVTTGSDEKLSTTSSSITLQPTKEENGTTVECVVRHKGMIAPVSRSAELNVLYAPNPPRISGLQSAPMESGEELRVNCIATDGNPLARITWLIDDEVIQTEYRHTRLSTQSELRHRLRPSDNGKVLICRAESPALAEPLEDQVKLGVYYPPKNITIESEPEEGTQENGVMTFTCRCSDSNPRASLAWYIDDVKLPLQWNDQMSSIRYMIRTLRSDESEASIELTLTSVRRQDADSTIKCKATVSEIGFEAEVTAHPKVNFPPKRVEVSVVSPAMATISMSPTLAEINGIDIGADSNEQIAYKAGDILLLKCVAKGGNPPPNLLWFLDGRPVVTDERTAISAAEVKVEEEKTSEFYDQFITATTMEITLQASHNGASISCVAGHSGYSEKPAGAKILKVAFPPETLTVEQFPSTLVARNPMSLTCKTSSSYPLAELTWYKGDVKLPPHYYVTLPSNKGKFGGFVASSRLQITPATDDDGATFTCRAEVQVLQEAVTRPYKLRVEYPPVFFPVNGNSTSYNATEGDSFIEIEVVAHANPYRMTFSWFRIIPMRNSDGETVLTKNSLTKDRRFQWNENKGLLRIHQLERGDGGLYMVRAINTRGSSDYNITLNVFYPPVVVSVSGPTSALTEGQSARLRCDFRSHPLAPPRVSWIKEGPGTGREKYNVQNFVDHSILALDDLRAADRGGYKCFVDNGIGKGHFRSINLQLIHTPVFDAATPRKVAVSSVGSDGTLYPNAILPCIVHSTPSATITWNKENETISAAGDDRYSILREVVDYETTRSKLRVNRIPVRDTAEKEGALAEFVCEASNVQGKNLKRIQIVLHGPPDTPSELKVLNVTASSVLLTWKEGFDGGLRQRFVVQYEEYTKESFGGKFEEITSHVSSRIIPNLEHDKNYVFRVVAKNDYGESAPSDIVRARTQASMQQGSTGARGIKKGYIIAVAVVFVIVVLVSIVVAVFTFRRCRISKQTYKPRTIETDCESLTHAESSLSSRCSSGKRDEHEKLVSARPEEQTRADGCLLQGASETADMALDTFESGQTCFFDCSGSRCSSRHSVEPVDDIGCGQNSCAFTSFKAGFQRQMPPPPMLDRLDVGNRSERTNRSAMNDGGIARNFSEPRFRFDVVPTDDCFPNATETDSNRHLDLPLPPALPPYEHRSYTTGPSAGSTCDIRSASSYNGYRDAKGTSARSSFRQYRTLEPTRFGFSNERYDCDHHESKTSFGRSNSVKQNSSSGLNSTGGCLYNLVSIPRGDQSYNDHQDYVTEVNEARVRGSQSSSSSNSSGLYVRSLDNMTDHTDSATKGASIVNDDGTINTFGLDFPPPPLEVIRESQSHEILQSGAAVQDFSARRPSAFTSPSNQSERFGRKSSLRGVTPTLPIKPTPSVRFRDELSKALNNPRPHDLQRSNPRPLNEHSDDDADSGCGGSADVAITSESSPICPEIHRNSPSSLAQSIDEGAGMVLRV